MDPIIHRKPRLFFDTAPYAPHITFDDGVRLRQTLPWNNFLEAQWNGTDAIKIGIGAWLVVLTGYNLGPLYAAIEQRALVRVCARPELQQQLQRSEDSFVTSIRFLPAKAPEHASVKRRARPQFELGHG